MKVRELGAQALGDRALVSRVEVGEQKETATDSAPDARAKAAARSSSPSASGATTPSGPVRSRAAKRSSSGTSAAGFGAQSR